jgi:hypothetical protein
VEFLTRFAGRRASVIPKSPAPGDEFSRDSAQMALLSSRFAKIYLPFFGKSENAEAYLSVVMPRECGASSIAAAYRFKLWRFWNTGSPAFAGDDSKKKFAF